MGRSGGRELHSPIERMMQSCETIREQAERSCANETITQGEPDGAAVQAGDTALPGPREKATKVCNKHLEACAKRTNTTRYLCKEKSHKERAKKEWRSLSESFS